MYFCRNWVLSVQFASMERGLNEQLENLERQLEALESKIEIADDISARKKPTGNQSTTGS